MTPWNYKIVGMFMELFDKALGDNFPLWEILTKVCDIQKIVDYTHLKQVKI